MLRLPTQLSIALGALALSSASALAVGSHPVTVSCPQETGDRRSLEDLLREVEVERARRMETLRPDVARIVEEMDDLRAPVRTSSSESKQRALRNLGAEVAPLLVPYLDPGSKPGSSGVFRSELVAEVLAGMESPTVTDELLALAREGSAIARLNALSVLGATPEPARVAAGVIAIAEGKFRSGIDSEQVEAVREAAFAALAALGTPEAVAFVQTTLTGSDVDLASAALKALQAAPVETSADAVLSVLAGPAAPRLGSAIATYYGTHQQLLEDFDHARLVGEVAVHETTETDARIELFDLLRVNDARVGTPVKRKIDDYTDFARSDVRQAALMLLARMKDRGARKALLEEFDGRIKEGRSPIDAYSDRAAMLHAIGDFSGAVKDWREVMTQMTGNTLQRRRKEPFIGIARSLAKLKKFREAKEYLEKAPISLQELQKLGSERDFAEMLASRYGDAFHLND